MSAEQDQKPSPYILKMALRRLIYKLTLYHPVFAQRGLEIAKTMAHHHDERSGGRVWWKVPWLGKEGSATVTGYISLQPGEFRLERPAGPNDIVYDLPPGVGTVNLVEELRRLAGIAGEYAGEEGGEMSVLLARARNLLALAETEPGQQVAGEFWPEVFDLVTEKQLSIQEVEQHVYEKYLLACRMDVTTFGAAALLAGLQVRVGKWWPQVDGFKTVVFALQVYLRWVSLEDPKILEVATTAGDFHFAAGKEGVKEALSALTLQSFHQRIYSAAYHYWCARLIAFCLEDHVAPPKLQYDGRTAEEGWAAMTTALASGLEDLVRDGAVEDWEGELTEALRRGGEEAAREIVRNRTRATNPILPRHYAEVSLARAMVAAGGRWLRPGVERLHELEKSFYERAQPGDTLSRELDRITFGLMAGYRDAGDQEKAEQYATQLAGKLLMQRLFDSALD